jgi:Trk K+ transport system NAD-binding subunit
MGALIAYRTKKYIYTLLGPFAGYVAGSSAFDVYEPGQMFLLGRFSERELSASVFAPAGSMVIEAGDQLHVIVRQEVAVEFQDLLRP